jgi:Alpha/beta hydrolase of unknown function (DUF900)
MSRIALVLVTVLNAGLFITVELFLLHRIRYRVLAGVVFLLLGAILFFLYYRARVYYRARARYREDLGVSELRGMTSLRGRKFLHFSHHDEDVQIESIQKIVLAGDQNALPPLSNLTPNCIIKKVFYATDRKPRVQDVGMLAYEGERHEEGKLAFGICTVTIPAEHKIGTLESPTIWKLQFSYNLSRHVTLVNVEAEEPAAFFRDIAQTVKDSDRKEAFVFVHGYNVSFEDAARRTAQISADLKFDGAAIFYSWPSRAEIKAYPIDETNVRWTVPHLRAFLVQLA